MRLQHILVLISLAALLLFPLADLSAQSEKTGRRKFENVVELVKLIERFRKAGFSDEDLKKLELLKEGDQKQNVLDYLEELRMAEKTKDEELQKFLNKRFLTVKDIYNHLVDAEPVVIKKLREELVSER